MKSESDFPRDRHRALSPHRFSRDPGQDQAREIAEGELVVSGRCHDEREGTVDALVLEPVAGVGAG